MCRFKTLLSSAKVNRCSCTDPLVTGVVLVSEKQDAGGNASIVVANPETQTVRPLERTRPISQLPVLLILFLLHSLPHA